MDDMPQTPDRDRPSPISDAPDQHGFVMMGTETLFLDHLAMFPMVNHRYQAILRVTVPPYAMAQYVSDRTANPSIVYILGNSQFDLMTLPAIHTRERTSFVADIFRCAPQDPNTTPPLLHNVRVEIVQVIVCRPFDNLFDYPPMLTYILYGAGNEAHLSHYMSREPDFQHCLDLKSTPDWLSPLNLESGVTINFPALKRGELPCANPFTQSSYSVLRGGQASGGGLVQIGNTYWFDTLALNATNPCATVP
jgi:hypothetical protein